MPKLPLSEQLDRAIHALLTKQKTMDVEPSLVPLTQVAGELRNLPRQEFRSRLKADFERRFTVTTATVNEVRAGFHTVTPYLIASDGPRLVEFVKKTFDAQELYSGTGSAGGLHAEVRIGDSMLMIGGGIPGREFQGTPKTHALHVYVEDVDAVYQKALASGATSLNKPVDQEYGERSGSVIDSAGNFWYVATHQGKSHTPESMHAVNVYMHPLHAEPLIRFLEQAFEGREIAKYLTPTGGVAHAQVQLGSSVIEMGEAHGPYQPMKSMFYLYVPNVDALYRQALTAGATSLSEPTDQPYGDRSAGVADGFGNTWFIAKPISEKR